MQNFDQLIRKKEGTHSTTKITDYISVLIEHGEIMVSFDVTSLYTNIPISYT